MKILVTGADGLLGSHLVARLNSEHEVVGLAQPKFELTDQEGGFATIVQHLPEVVVHTAAMTDVDACERDPALAEAVNATGAGVVAHACAETGAFLLHISTDMVFGGDKHAPYWETDPPHPINVYGRTKWKGEEEVQKAGCRALILRTAWLFGPGGKNYLSNLPALLSEGKPVQAVIDQTSSPTYAQDLAELIAALPPAGQEGIIHVTNRGNCTPFEAAQVVARALKKAASLIPIRWSDLGRHAARPAYSALRNTELSKWGISALRDFRLALTEYALLAVPPAKPATSR